jgi:hypothetical protein
MADIAGIGYLGITAAVFFRKITEVAAAPGSSVAGPAGTYCLFGTLVLQGLVVI